VRDGNKELVDHIRAGKLPGFMDMIHGNREMFINYI
jgi:hypothetical protein